MRRQILRRDVRGVPINSGPPRKPLPRPRTIPPGGDVAACAFSVRTLLLRPHLGRRIGSFEIAVLSCRRPGTEPHDPRRLVAGVRPRTLGTHGHYLTWTILWQHPQQANSDTNNPRVEGRHVYLRVRRTIASRNHTRSTAPSATNARCSCRDDSSRKHTNNTNSRPVLAASFWSRLTSDSMAPNQSGDFAT